MNQFIIVTTADPSRPGLSYKVDVPEWLLEEWYTNNMTLLLSRQKQHVENLPSNTSITWVKPSGEIETKGYLLEWIDIAKLLSAADLPTNTYESDVREPGRPRKRALVLTTSYERRTGALVARTGY